MFRRKQSIWLAVGLVAAAFSVGAPRAGASVQPECDNIQLERCYSTIVGNESNRGARYWLRVSDGLVYNPSQMFAIATQWIAMQSNWWVEAGYGYGTFVCGPRTTPQWYTARYNASGYLEVCFGSTPAVGSDHEIIVDNGTTAGSTKWSVYLDGALAWFWTDMRSTGTRIDVGVEVNHWASHLVNARAWSYRKRKLDGGWSPTGWSPAVHLTGAPSAFGTVGGFGIWDHGFWGI